MTELEKMKRAKMYIEKLADGIDPLTDTELPNDTVLNNVRLSRCFFYVSDILNKVIENGGTVKSNKSSYKEFYITEEQKKMLIPSNQDMYIKDITDLINSVTVGNDCKKFQYKWVTSWLVTNGFLTECTDEFNKKVKKVTDAGKSIGLKNELRNGMYGDYIVTLYNHDAQAFIYDNLDSILSEKTSSKENSENYGAPWSKEQDDMLLDLFEKQTPIHEIAVTLKRSDGAIRRRLERQGLFTDLKEN